MRYQFFSTVLVLLAIAAPAFAGEKCVCRANGKNFEEGQVTCFRLPSGMKLARCERVLNNTSWKMLGDGCPSAVASSAGQQLALCLPGSLPDSTNVSLPAKQS